MKKEKTSRCEAEKDAVCERILYLADSQKRAGAKKLNYEAISTDERVNMARNSIYQTVSCEEVLAKCVKNRDASLAKEAFERFHPGLVVRVVRVRRYNIPGLDEMADAAYEAERKKRAERERKESPEEQTEEPEEKQLTIPLEEPGTCEEPQAENTDGELEKAVRVLMSASFRDVVLAMVRSIEGNE